MPNKAHPDEIATIRNAILDIIEDDPPMTVRQVFYQLVSRGMIEKTEPYQGTVIRLMTEMRLDDSCPMTGLSMRAAASGSPRPSTMCRTPSSTPRTSTAAARWRSLTTTSKSGGEGCAGGRDVGCYLGLRRAADGVARHAVTHLPARLRAGNRKRRRAAASGLHLPVRDHDPSGVLIPQTIERRLGEMCEKLGCPPPIVERSP